MTRDALTKRVGKLTDLVLADVRWKNESDDLGVSVLGMLLYGYALAIGRLVMFLDMEDIDAAVLNALTERAVVAAKWGSGLVAEANASAFDKEHHPGHHELIGVGHSYASADDQAAVVENVFANIQSVRQRSSRRT